MYLVKTYVNQVRINGKYNCKRKSKQKAIFYQKKNLQDTKKLCPKEYVFFTYEVQVQIQIKSQLEAS
jgi:hypothetical protein